MRIAIIAALSSELKPLVKGWASISAPDRRLKAWICIDNDGDELVAACAGMGAKAAQKAFAFAESRGPVDLVLSVGLAGSLSPELHAGSCCVLSEVIDVQTGERFALSNGKWKFRIATTAEVADAMEKRRLFETYGAVMVDMEAATIARLAQMRGIPMCCIKAVSDERDAQLPNINRWIADGHLKLPAFLAYVALRPRYWVSLIALGRGSALASKSLGETVNRFLIDKNWDRANRTGSVGV